MLCFMFYDTLKYTYIPMFEQAFIVLKDVLGTKVMNNISYTKGVFKSYFQKFIINGYCSCHILSQMIIQVSFSYYFSTHFFFVE